MACYLAFATNSAIWPLFFHFSFFIYIDIIAFIFLRVYWRHCAALTIQIKCWKCEKYYESHTITISTTIARRQRPKLTPFLQRQVHRVCVRSFVCAIFRLFVCFFFRYYARKFYGLRRETSGIRMRVMYVFVYCVCLCVR